ncbi:MAG: metal ABC transporter substrate-binding protein, partial [Methylobacterium sp.]
MSFPQRLRRPAALGLALVGTAGTLAACGDGAAGGADGDRPVVAATAPQIDGIVRALAGDGVEVASVVAATADVHELELRPSQVRALKGADLVLQPGRGNDAWAAEA